MKIKLSNNFLGGLILLSIILAACNGTSNSSGNQTNITENPTLSGLAYDPLSKSVYSVDQSGVLCKLALQNVPGKMSCNLTVPNNIIISSQVVSDNQGNIYALGSQATTESNFILKYQTQTNTWTVNNIDIPFVMSFSKLLYRQGQLYLADPNESALYTIQLATNQLESVPDFFIPGPATIEDFDQSGNLYFSYQLNTESNFRTVTTTQVYLTPLGSSATPGIKFGADNKNINDLVYIKNTAYACAESDFLYLPADSSANANWQILTNSAESGYFSCDYLTTDGNNLYYVEGQWGSENSFSNNYVNTIKIQ
ncbi:hypothetical protein [Aquella oligotrophica]|uniref:Uncharacterized protein n=1 Tax=Aquella oligotrophica TaxID=2067065 RepID=A0A2I7N8N7_9NEIS|nr:hypothetical protein [Aquella oligotrophica]AUR52820.1 hypothetical protein CUN60_11115 [Aquella oligotrophica]